MTAWLGAGLCPAGLTPCGYGYFQIQETATPRAFKLPDGSTGDAPLIDAKTGDYVLDDQGQKLGMTAVQQQVLLALKTIKDSAITGYGIGVFPPTINDRTQTEIEALVTNALADLRLRGLVALKSVKIVKPKEGALLIYVEWLDVSRGTTEKTEL